MFIYAPLCTNKKVENGSGNFIILPRTQLPLKMALMTNSYNTIYTFQFSIIYPDKP